MQQPEGLLGESAVEPEAGSSDLQPLLLLRNASARIGAGHGGRRQPPGARPAGVLAARHLF